MKQACHIQKNNWRHLFLLIKFAFKRKVKFWKRFIYHLDLVASSMMRSGVILMSVIFWYCVMKCVNIWKVCITQWTIIFFKWPMLQTHAWVKNPFNVQEISLDFNVIQYKKYIVTVSNSTWQLTCKKLPLAKFGYSIKVEYPQLFENTNRKCNCAHLCDTSFLHIFHPKPHLTTHWMQKQVWESGCLLLSLTFS